MPSKSDLKVYFYAKHQALSLRSHNWVVIDGQPDDISGACHKLYDKILDESIRGAGILQFSKNRGYTTEELFALAQFKDFSLAKKAWDLLQKEDLIKVGKNNKVSIIGREVMFENETERARRLRLYREKKRKEEGVQKVFKRTPVELPLVPSLDNPNPLSRFESFKLIHEREGIQKFWETYPKKKNPEAVIGWWVKNQPTNDDAEAMCIALARDMRSDNWMKDTGRFIPDPDKWLALHRWSDEDLKAYYRSKEGGA